MYYLIGAVFTTCVLYWLLQKKDEQENRQRGGNNVIVFFLLLIVMTVLFYLLGNAFSGVEDRGEMMEQGGKDYTLDMVRNIKEDVIVGLPPFQ
jgi:heme/copper-type cytochrome/quinol oxidase subunit 2